MKTHQLLRPLIRDAMDREGSYETAHGWLRYEALRTLDLRQLAALQQRNLEGEMFDDMVDELILREVS